MTLVAPEITFVVVTWNCAPELAGLLSSLRDHVATEYEVVVVDNGSIDDVEAVCAADPRVRMLRRPDNPGFGVGTNAGVAEARADVCVLINPDTYLLDGSIVALARVARSSGALLGPRVLNPDGSHQPSASATPGGWETVLSAVLPAGALPAGLAERLEPWRSAVTREVGWLTGACIAGRTDVLTALGPFAPHIHMYSEDLELGLRARTRRVRSCFCPDLARIVHIGDASSAQRYPDAGRRVSLANRFAVVAAHRGRARSGLDVAALLMGLSVRWAVKRALGRDTARERAWLSAAREWLAGQRAGQDSASR